jgi:hypothetical protein
MAILTLGLMDPPYESGNTVTGFRIVDADSGAATS